MELLHEVFTDKVGKVDLVQGVAQHGKENLLKKQMVSINSNSKLR